MQRELLKAKSSRLPQLPALNEQGNEFCEGDELEPGGVVPRRTVPVDAHHDDDDEEDEEERDQFPSTLPSRTSTTSNRPRQFMSGRTTSTKDYSPLTAEGYFTSALEIDIPESASTFRVYYTPPVHAAPSTSTESIDDDDGLDIEAECGGMDAEGAGTVFVCVHGAGYSGLSFACFARQVTEKSRAKVGVLSFDARGHGKTKASAEDMSLERLVQDLIDLLKQMYKTDGVSPSPSFVLVGHSMGGAVVSTACNRIQAEIGTVIGVVVIDVVEGTAIDALASMGSIIAAKPKEFPSVESAIEWHVRTKTLNNLASARISVPPLVHLDPSAKDEGGQFSQTKYLWRADLSATEPFWRDWFTGLSSKFLSCRCAKLLLLAGAETLDKELMIGQMQGKYQLEVITQSGHCVQEDHPVQTAELLLSFWQRNDRTDILKGVKKVGQV
ncbi:BQ2448_6323 [Microbotryum intermedium]|uniref:Protein phosphatase methylesterase 1 n=1 Tax=Microbotryum intermedium TaxID=269621 RepID=A0A238FPF8_9BASI|nr:BQ2448_6323 [Microbotryum intermedium]